jgi:elongation factor P
MMYGHNDLKKGVVIELEGAPHQVVESSHIAMGRGGAVMRTKLKNLQSGAVFDKSFRSSDKVPAADLTRENMQYLYGDDGGFHFMNQDTYEQVTLDKGIVGDSAPYLKEGGKAIILLFNSKPIGLDIGNNVLLRITETEPGAKGDTATTALKPAKTETGLEVMVPLFINEGDVIKVDTRDGKYLERQK